MKTTNRRYLDSVDEYLGPAGTRFFGSGYRRVRYRLADVVSGAGPVEPGPARATVAVSYPADWSRKSANVDLRPHLSTIDALILGTRLAELHLNHTYDMDLRQRRTAWLRRVEIKAGSAPYEDGLDALAVEASLRTTTPAPGSLADGPGGGLGGGHVSSYDCRVGNMRVGCEIAHEIRPAGNGSRRSMAELDESAGRRLYGEGYQNQGQAVEQVTVDPDEQRAQARIALTSAPGRTRPGDGLEAAYRPSVSMIDSFVVSLQLGQVLLYELDGIDRARSNTLWMRHTTITSQTPHRPAADPVTATTSLVDSRLLQAYGGTWRTATIVGDCHGVHTRCAVTHQIPEGNEVARP